MTGALDVDHEALSKLAERITSQLSPLFESTLGHFEETEVPGPAFSMEGLDLQATYPGIRHLAMRDLETKSQAVRSIIDRLKTTAEGYHQTETSNTPKVN